MVTTTRETAIEALIEVIAGAYAWTFGPARRLKLWGDVPAVNRPACFLFQGGQDTYAWTEGAVPKRIIEIKLFIYLNAKDPTAVGGALSDDVMDALDTAFALSGADIVSGRNTLGGAVYQCRIDGKILKDPGDLDGDVVLIVPVKIILP